MRSLFDFTIDFLSINGALLEDVNEELEVLLPPDLARCLEIPEHVHLSFSLDGKETVSLTYDSELFKNIGKFLENRGRFSIANISAPPMKLEKLEEKIHENLILNNAVFSLEKIETKTISYLLAYFKYIALSDEREEGIAASLINEFNLSLKQWKIDSSEIWRNMQEGFLEGGKRHPPHTVLKSLYRAQIEIIKEKLQEFVKSLERRLNRDIDRVYHYYQTLIEEIRHTIEKKELSGEEKQKAPDKIETIEAETEMENP